LGKKYGHAYEAFKVAITEPAAVFEGIDIDENIHKELLSTIARRLTPKPVKIRSDIELTCYTYEGINAIKAALRAGEAVSTEAVPIKIRLVAPPLYVMSTTSTDKTSAIDLMEQAIVKIQDKMAEFEGNMNVAMSPKAVSETEDNELAKLMEKVERENQQVSGDDDSDAEDE